MQPALCLLLAVLAAEPAEDLNCLKPGPGEPPAASLFYAHLQRQAYQALDRRQTAFEELKSPEQVAAYQKRMRGFFVERLGGFPERTLLNAKVVGKSQRTSLNAKVVGKIDSEGYYIEKVIFESQPNHHVTASL